EQVQALHVGQLLVQQHQVERRLRQHDQCVGGGAAAGDAVIDALQTLAHQQGHVVVVFDEEQLQRVAHEAPSSERGRNRDTVVPLPGMAPTRTAPPPLAAAERTRKKPRPKPVAPGWRAAANGSTNWANWASAMPRPWSLNSSQTPPPSGRTATCRGEGRPGS